MGNVAIYCRVSTQQQSTDRQLEELTKLAAEKGLTVAKQNVYLDVISGFKKGEVRPEFSRMIEDIEKGEIDFILFSEFSRLARNATELLEQINYFKEKNVTVYFQKQNITVNNDNNNIGNTILLHVLAVMSSYEIELFTERSLSGKITKVQAGGGAGDEHAYGYKNVNKKITINEEEAGTVYTIFKMYAEGISTINIADYLNANNIPSPYYTRVAQFIENRKKKGLEEKEYKNFDVEKLKWRASTISRMLSNRLYTGERNITFYKPDPTNTFPTWKRSDREIVYNYNEKYENLRIISDELFEIVQDRLSKAKYNKNNSIKHNNLLKAKLVCGECGGNFSVGNSDAKSAENESKRTYKCYGIISRKDKKRTCETGSEIRQTRLDGLVVHYSLKMFAQLSIDNINKDKMQQLKQEIEQLNTIVAAKKDERAEVENNYKTALKRLMKVNNAIVEELIAEETDKYNKSIAALNKAISKIEKDIVTKNILLVKLQKMQDTYVNLYNKMQEIRANKELVKEMIDEYIDVIQVFRIEKNWNLIIIKYSNNVELWGTIKAARYKNDEMFFDEITCKNGIEYKSWCIDNTEHCFSYNKDTHIIIYNGNSKFELYKDFVAGEYTYQQFNDLLVRTENLNSYPLYKFE